MGLFRKKKRPKYVDELWGGDAPSSLEQKKTGDEDASGSQQDQQKNPAMEYCEQILTAAKALEETKRDYKTVTDYLTDIQKIEDLPEKEFSEVEEVAKHVVELNNSRDAYLNKSRNISDAQFAQMEQLQDQMPDIIRRLKENEAYQTTVKRDMQYLEGEREEWRYYKDALEQESRVLRKLLLVLAGVFVAAAVLIAILGMALHFDITLPFLAATLVAAVIGIAMVWRLQNDGVDIKRSQANINRAITLLNKISFKYVNVTNAVDYACEKYHAKNSYELNYIWEQYMEELRERDKYQKTNDELEYFNDKLVMLLQQYRLYDAKVWIYQAQALLDKKEMVEVKHELIVRRQKLRATLESQIANIRKAQADIVKIVKERPGDEKEIKNILKSVDEICGLA
ncbi:MAG: hypothetical protein HFH36_12305 [Lachnospiraceae bacterium]|nr:hypothetical protein [Lachnospiraceae bacterium]